MRDAIRIPKQVPVSEVYDSRIQGKIIRMLMIVGSKIIITRFIIRAQIPTEAGNRLMQNPNGMQDIEAYMKSVKAEAAYFFEAGGDRTMVFVVNMNRTDQMAVLAEPLFMMGAKVEFQPVMLLEDLKKADESLSKH